MTTILDAHGWNATYTSDCGTISLPLVFWLVEDGIPLGFVLSQRTGRPGSAERAPNFAGYERDGDADATTVPAEPGWWIVERDGNGSEHAYWSKVLAWRIPADGFGIKAIGAPFPDGTPILAEVEDERVQFCFDPTRAPVAHGHWPTPVNVVEAGTFDCKEASR